MPIYKGSVLVGGGLIPNYSAGTALTANTDFTAPEKGWVMGEYSAAQGGYCQLKINNVVIQQVGSESSQRCRSSFSAPVSKGMIVHIVVVGNSNLPLATFFPVAQ